MSTLLPQHHHLPLSLTEIMRELDQQIELQLRLPSHDMAQLGPRKLVEPGGAHRFCRVGVDPKIGNPEQVPGSEDAPLTVGRKSDNAHDARFDHVHELSVDTPGENRHAGSWKFNEPCDAAQLVLF